MSSMHFQDHGGAHKRQTSESVQAIYCSHWLQLITIEQEQWPQSGVTWEGGTGWLFLMVLLTSDQDATFNPPH